jgi:hypothetical protein
MNFPESGELFLDFLSVLHDLTKGNVSSQVSMYQVGEKLGLDRDSSLKTAEPLMGEGLVEVRTLSGGIGITENGKKKIAPLKSGDAGVKSALSGSPVPTSTDRKSIEPLINTLKLAVNSLGLDFDGLADLTVDIKTIDLQLTSKTPKTAIIRECFLSILSRLEKCRAPELKKQIKEFIGL